jgi:hypothetical protein
MANEIKFGSKVVFLGGTPITLPSQASDPGSAVNGDMYYNSTSDTIRVYQSGSWQSLATGGAAANTTLSNLGTTAINAALLPASTNTINLGNGNLKFNQMFINQLRRDSGEGVTGRAVLDVQNFIAYNGTETAIFKWDSSTVELSTMTATTVPYLDANKRLQSSTVTPTELGYLSGVTSALQTQLGNKAADNVVIKKDGSVAYLANQSMGGFKLTSLAAGSANGDSVRYEQAILASGVNAFAANQSMGGFKLTNLADGTLAQDAVSKTQMETADGLKVSKSGDTMSGNLAMGGNLVTGLGAPVGANDAVRKAYADAISAGSVWLNPINDPDLIDDSLSTPPGSPVVGDTYIVADTATGAWAGLEGYAVFWSGSAWVDILGRAVIAGDRFGVSMETPTAAAGGLATKENNIAQIVSPTPGAITYTFTAPILGQAVFVFNTASTHSGHQYNYNGTSWVEFGGASAITPGVGLSFSGNVLNVNLGAGIAQLPSDEVGIDVHTSGGLFTTVDNSTSSTVTAAQLAVKLDGSTLSKSSSGLKVAALGITNSEISASAAIVYTKLNISNSVVNADIASGANIALNKLATVTASRALVSDGSGFISAASVTATELSYLSGATSSIQTQLGNKASTTLDNLGTTAINTNLIPSATNSHDLGTTSVRWKDLYLAGAITSAGGASFGAGITATGTISSGAYNLTGDALEVSGGAVRVSSFTTPITGVAAASLFPVSPAAVPVSIFTRDNSTNDAVASGDALIETGDKTDGTGNSGSIKLQTGSSVGGTRGSIELDARAIALRGTVQRSDTAGGSSLIEEQYIHATTLAASQTNAIVTALNFAHASYEGVEITYKIKEATTNAVRTGKLSIATNGTDVSIVDSFNETADVGVTWSAVVNGANINVRYTTTANTKTARMDIKRFKA